MHSTSLPVVHAVTDSASMLKKGFVERAEGVMQALGGRGAVHLRCSRTSGRRFYEIAAQVAELQERTGCWLIVNDRVDVARAVGARGIQLASHSLQISEALLVAPQVPMGASVHSVAEALVAEKAGASWCVAGTIFETPSHEGRPPARVDFIRQLAGAISIPIIAIGGVTPENVVEMIAAGAYGVATIRGVGWENNLDQPVTRYISAYDSVSGAERDDHLDGERSFT